MTRRRVTFRLVALRLTLAPALALLAIGLVVNAAYVHAFGPGSGWWPATQIVGGTGAGLALMFSLFFGSTQKGIGFTVWCCLVFFMIAAFMGMNQRALQERGRTSMCLVEDEQKEQTTEHSGGTGPGDPGTTTTRTDYRYRLRCPEGGPRSMVTGSSAGHAGATIAVRWDPAGQVEPRPTSEVFSSRVAFQIAFVLGGTGVFLVLLDALLDACRDPKESAWGPGFFYDLAYRLK